jgi:hypothetical protein
VVIKESAVLIVSLWILFTWAFEGLFDTNPFLRIISATPGCGKSTLLKVIELLVRAPLNLATTTKAAFTRTLRYQRCTMLLDEGDAFLNSNGPMRNVLDGASDPRGANISFCVSPDDDYTPTIVNVYVPIAIASIGSLHRMHTVEDRSIPINIKRVTQEESLTIEKARPSKLPQVLEPLAQKCARWVSDNLEHLKRHMNPRLPEVLIGREQDKWEPLVAIADTLGPQWGERARKTAVEVSSASQDGKSLGELLVWDVVDIFTNLAEEQLKSSILCQELAKLENRPWGEFSRGKEITPMQLSNLLRPFQIQPQPFRGGEKQARGYKLAAFADVLKRYPAPSKASPAPDPSEDQACEHEHNIRSDASHAAQDPEHLHKRTVAYIGKALEVVTAEDIYDTECNFGDEVEDIYENECNFDEEVEAVNAPREPLTPEIMPNGDRFTSKS